MGLTQVTVGDSIVGLRHSIPPLCIFSSQPPLSCLFSAFLAGFWGMGQTPACWLEMNELQGTMGLEE